MEAAGGGLPETVWTEKHKKEKEKKNEKKIVTQSLLHLKITCQLNTKQDHSKKSVELNGTPALKHVCACVCACVAKSESPWGVLWSDQSNCSALTTNRDLISHPKLTLIGEWPPDWKIKKFGSLIHHQSWENGKKTPHYWSATVQKERFFRSPFFQIFYTYGPK